MSRDFVSSKQVHALIKFSRNVDVDQGRHAEIGYHRLPLLNAKSHSGCVLMRSALHLISQVNLTPSEAKKVADDQTDEEEEVVNCALRNDDQFSHGDPHFGRHHLSIHPSNPRKHNVSVSVTGRLQFEFRFVAPPHLPVDCDEF
jgi:hypothetical protein